MYICTKMKYIEKENLLYLSENDCIIIKSQQKKNESILIECIDGILNVDNVSAKRIKELSMEQEQLVILENLNKKKVKVKTFYKNPLVLEIDNNCKITYHLQNRQLV